MAIEPGNLSQAARTHVIGEGRTSSHIGLWFYGLAAIATGVVDLVWGRFEPAHQPIQAFGDNIPGQTLFAYVAAVCLVAGGLGVLWTRTARTAAAMLGVIYLMFAVFPLPRLYTAPHVLGVHLPIYVGVLAGVCQQLILAAAAAILFCESNGPGVGGERALLKAARFVFGLSSIDFGLAHLTDIAANSVYVPQWMPLGGHFWTAVTGGCFVLAGIAILTGVLDTVAAWLLGLMLLVFSVVVLAPSPVAAPHNQIAWGANAYNLAAVGAAWILAAYLSRRRRKVGA